MRVFYSGPTTFDLACVLTIANPVTYLTTAISSLRATAKTLPTFSNAWFLLWSYYVCYLIL